MKNPSIKRCASGIAGLTLIYITFQSCSTFNKVYSETDIVYSSLRFELKYYVKDRDRRSPLFCFTQSIIKEINSQDEISYYAYDVLSLSGSSFKPDEKVFLLIDNEAYPMVIDKMELENVRSISENTGNISTSDSTSVSVITGYSEDNRKITRFRYKIPASTMAKIKESDQFSLRYYSGPSMITVKPKNKSIRMIKQLIDTTV
ncbi:MAG: hypothetical protein WAW07_03385 [Bacteroidales bacterium]